MWSLAERAAVERPSEVLLADDHGRSLTARQLVRAAESVAAGLHERGIGPSSKVSWQLPTSLELPVLMLALSRLGAVQNPIIPLLREAEVSVIAAEVKPDLFVAPETWNGFGHAAMGRDLGLEVLALDLGPEPEDDLRLPAGDPSKLPAPPTPSSMCRWIYYSSGTTSAPKGVRHSDLTATAASNGVVDLLGLSTGDRYPIAWPLTHIGGLAMLGAVLRAGGTLITFDTYDPATTPTRMAAHDPTLLGSATPFFLAYTAAQREHGDEPLYPSLRTCVAGGAPIPTEVNREVVEVLGVDGIADAWGLTEFPVATSEVPASRRIGVSSGTPSPGVEVRVVDGELRVRGPQCFLGYVDSSLDTDAFDDEGWFRTGDLGRIDDEGHVHIEGRSKDVIIRNAENVSAREVEEVVLRHPAVADVAVVGVPDPATGERVAAVVVLHPGTDVSLEALADHCLREGLARFKRPERLVERGQIPRNSMGKILKEQLRSELL
jgi:cyclohexanecarboxylate-CoA ligase